MLVTLDCDRPPINAASSNGTGKTDTTAAKLASLPALGSLSSHVFSEHDLQHDPLSSFHFVTSFDMYECTQLATSFAAAETLPPDIIEMLLALDEQTASMTAAADASVAAAAASPAKVAATMVDIDSGMLDASSKPHPAARHDGDDADSTATEELDEEARRAAAVVARNTLARTLSDLMKKGASGTPSPASGVPTAVPAAAGQPLLRPSLSQAAAAAPPLFSSVKEETMSDLEGSSSDASSRLSSSFVVAVAREASSSSTMMMMNASMIAASPSIAGSAGGQEGARTMARTLSSASDAPPPLVPYNKPVAAQVSAAPGPSPSPVPGSASPLFPPPTAADVEQQLAEFVGVPLPSLSASLSVSLPPMPSLQSPPLSQEPGGGGGGGLGLDAPAGASLGGEGRGLLDRGLSTAVDAFVLQSDLAVQTEAPAGTLGRSYSLLHDALDNELRGVGTGEHGGGDGGGAAAAAAAAAAASSSSELGRGMSTIGASGSGGRGGSGDPMLARQDSGMFGVPQPSGLLSPSISFSAGAVGGGGQHHSHHHLQIPSRLSSLAGSGWAEQAAALRQQSTSSLLRRASSFGRMASSAVGAGVMQPLAQATFMHQYNEDVQQQHQQHQQQRQHQAAVAVGGFSRMGSIAGPSGGGAVRMLESPIPFGSQGNNYSYGGVPLQAQLSMSGSPRATQQQPRAVGGSGSQQSASYDSIDYEASVPQVGQVGRLASYEFEPHAMRPLFSQQHTQPLSHSQSPSPPASVSPAPSAAAAAAGGSRPQREKLNADTVARLSRGVVTAAPTPADAAASARAIAQLLWLLRLSATLREHLEDFCKRLGTDSVTAGLAGHIAREMQARKLSASRESASICVTALYVAYKLRGLTPMTPGAADGGRPMTQKVFCASLGKTEVTMRKILYNDIAPRWFELVPEDFEPVMLPPEFPPRPPQPKLGPTAGRPKRLAMGEMPPPARSASSVLHALHGEQKQHVLDGDSLSDVEQQALAQQRQPQIASQPLEGEPMGPPAPRRPSLHHRLSSRRPSGTLPPGSPASLSSSSAASSVLFPSSQQRSVPPGFVVLQGALRSASGGPPHNLSQQQHHLYGSASAGAGAAGVLRFLTPLSYSADGQSRIHVVLKPRAQAQPAVGGAADVGGTGSQTVPDGSGSQSPPRPYRVRASNLPSEAREADSDASTDEDVDDGLQQQQQHHHPSTRGGGVAPASGAAHRAARHGQGGGPAGAGAGAAGGGGGVPFKRTRTLLAGEVPIEFGRPKAAQLLSQHKLSKLLMSQ
jgi:hypothetical protein